MGRYLSELVSVGPCRYFRDRSAPTIPQHWCHILKTSNFASVAAPNFPVHPGMADQMMLDRSLGQNKNKDPGSPAASDAALVQL